MLFCFGGLCLPSCMSLLSLPWQGAVFLVSVLFSVGFFAAVSLLCSYPRRLLCFRFLAFVFLGRCFLHSLGFSLVFVLLCLLRDSVKSQFPRDGVLPLGRVCSVSCLGHLSLIVLGPLPVLVGCYLLLSAILWGCFFFVLFGPFGSILTAPLISPLVLAPYLFLPVILHSLYPSMLSVSFFGRLSLRPLLLPPLPLCLWAPLLLCGSTAFGVLLPLPFFSVLFDPECLRVLLWESSSIFTSFYLSNVQFFCDSGFGVGPFVAASSIISCPTLFSLSLMPFSLSCPALLLYIVFFWFRFRVVRFVILFSFLLDQFLDTCLSFPLACFSFSFQPLFHTWGARWGGGGSLWVLAVPVLLHLGSKAERLVHSATISLDLASGPTPQWELQSLSHVVALLHLISSCLRSD